MNRKLKVIYITGVGDQQPTSQRWAVRTWRWYGVESELYQMHWANDETWPAKFERLLARVDEVIQSGQPLALVSVSAGASATINVFAARKDKIVGVVCLAGKINRPEVIGRHYTDENPALKPSVAACQQALATLTATDRKRILSRYAVWDNVLARADSHIPGARNRIVPTLGHIPTIATQITLGAPSFVRFLKRLNKQ
jgi:hypothetical protein